MKEFFKKALSVVTAMVMALSLMTGIPFSVIDLGITASAATSGVSSYHDWSVDDNGTFTIKGSYDLNPTRYKMVGYSLQSLPPWYYQCKDSITKVVIGDYVTSIGEYAFYNLQNLTSVTIPKGVTSIGENAFRGCSNLKSITIPDGVTSIGANAFYLVSLESITIPASVKTIGENAFDFVPIVNLPCSWNENPIYTFNSYGVGKVNIADHTTENGECVCGSIFGTCGSALKWSLVDGTLTISGTGAMADWASASEVPWNSYKNKITNVVIENGVTSIGDYAFDGCTSIKTVTAPCGWKKAPLYTFGSGVTVNIADHSGWAQSASGAVVSITCTDCKNVIGTITLNAPTDLTYNGAAKTATITNTFHEIFTPKTISYCCDGGCINAGDHTASIDSEMNTLETVTASVGFTITAKPLSDAAAVQSNTLTYNGTEQTPAFTITDSTPFTANDYDVEVTPQTNAGDYTAKITLKGNYTGTIENAAWSIGKATPVITVTTDKPSDIAGKTIAVTITAKHPTNEALTDIPAAALTYKVGENGTETAFTDSFVIPEGTDTGAEIIITAKTAEDSNYKSATSTAKVVVTDCPHTDVQTEWKTDGTSHWHICNYCSAEVDKAACSGGTADCMNKAVCGTCNQAHGEVNSTNHGNNVSTAWTTENDYHWHECACEADLDKAACTGGTATCTTAALCDVCGIAHGDFDSNNHVNVATVWSKDSDYHWHECSCGADLDKAGHTSNGSATATTPETCTVCGYEIASATSVKPNSTPTPNPTPIITADNEPQIKGDNGKTGWAVILDELTDAEDGDTVVVDMNGTTKLPKDITSEIKGRDIDLVLDMGNGITWTINGLDVTNPKNVDMRVAKGTKRIPVDVINNVTGESYTVQLSLAHNGDFGFTAVLTVDLGKKNNGLYANLFWYNEKSDELEFADFDEITNGKANLIFTHASDWAIVIDEEALGEFDDVSSAAGVEDTSEVLSDSNTAPIAVVSISLAGFALAVVVMKKRKTE